jgi:hypothetical protein
MKKQFILLFILFSVTVFSQEKRKKPIEIKIGFFTESFYRGSTLDSTLSEEGNVMKLYAKNEGFKKSLYGLKLLVSKPIGEKTELGFELGFGRTRDVRNQVDRVYYYVIPVSLVFNYNLYKIKNKAVFKPFLRLKTGYTYMNDDVYENFGLLVSGGFSYGVDIGFSINNKEAEWLDNLFFTIGYSNFFKNHEEKRTGPPYTVTFNYKTRNEGLNVGLQYQIPLKHKKKRRKHR